MKTSDSWDWPLLLYSARKVLGYSDREFWKLTPRKLNALIRIHAEVRDPKNNKNEGTGKPGYIDQVM